MKAINFLDDTITAVATAVGESSVAIVRLSGKDSLSIVKKIASGKQFNKSVEPRKMYLVDLDINGINDNAMVVYFKAPHSFTGEDVVEIQCHGNYFLAKRITEGLIKNGCRPAENGEFTKRAFLNNKIDLTKAEGIFDIINAKSEAEINCAFKKVSGELFTLLDDYQKTLITLIAKAEVCIDYPEEDIEEITKVEISNTLQTILSNLNNLKQSYNNGKILAEGIKVSIVGKPNVGKSMLLNKLLSSDRAIVTDIAGTTRDTIEESFLYKGMRIVFTDTAGIRETSDTVEKIGINKSYLSMENADIILAVSDENDDFNFDVPQDKKVIKVVNKIDKLKSKTKDNKNTNTKIYISALENKNIELLKQTIYDIATKEITKYDTVINNLRHLNAVTNAILSLSEALDSLQTTTMDCVLTSLNDGFRYLGTVTGTIASDEIVNEIFSKFCVGK